MKKKHKNNGSGNGEDKLDGLNIKDKFQRGEKSITDEGMLVEIEELKDEIEILRKELAHYKELEEGYLDKLKRLHADYDNYRKRVLREQIDTISKANKDLIEKLLPVIDSFEHALAMGEELKGYEDDFIKGVKLIYDSLIDTLKKEGLSVIDPYDEEFNPQECEAAVTENIEDMEEGTILEVLRKGYKLNDFLIRPAVVKVCKKS